MGFSNGHKVVIPEQAGKAEQPDIIAYEPAGEKLVPTAYEVEIRAGSPAQVEKNYRKNVKHGMAVVFVTPDEAVAGRVREILRRIGGKARIWVFRPEAA